MGSLAHVLQDSASIAFQAHRGPRSAMKRGLEFPPALVSAWKKWQGLHFPQLPVEDLSLFLLLVYEVCMSVCVCERAGVYF